MAGKALFLPLQIRWHDKLRVVTNIQKHRFDHCSFVNFSKKPKEKKTILFVKMSTSNINFETERNLNVNNRRNIN